MNIPVFQLISILLHLSAGACIFLMLLNRALILVPSSRTKRRVILAVFISIFAACALLGYFSYHSPWVFAPAALLGMVLLGEVRRVWIRRSCAAPPPIDTIPHHVDIANPVTTTDFVVHRYQVPHPKWHGEPLRIVHLTDLHVHPNLPLEYYKDVLSVAEQTAPDVAAFTGDFITCSGALPMLKKVLRPIASRGNYAVLGNHDYWANPDAVGRVIAESGLHLLSGESLRLTVGDSEIAFTGYDYPWGTRQKTIPPHAPDMLHIVLSHTPDNIYRISRSGADVVLCGHYHAGQIRLPFFGSIIVPSVYGRRFDHGHFIVKGTHLFVASGIGAVYPPVRIYCQPDIFVVDIVPTESRPSTKH